MTIKDIYKLFYHDKIYTLKLIEHFNNGECIPKYYQDCFTTEDWERKVSWLDVRDETIDIDDPTIIIYCYVKGD